MAEFSPLERERDRLLTALQDMGFLWRTGAAASVSEYGERYSSWRNGPRAEGEIAPAAPSPAAAVEDAIAMFRAAWDNSFRFIVWRRAPEIAMANGGYQLNFRWHFLCAVPDGFLGMIRDQASPAAFPHRTHAAEVHQLRPTSMWGVEVVTDDFERITDRQSKLASIDDAITGLCATHDLLLTHLNNGALRSADADIVTAALPHLNDIIAAFARRSAEMRANIFAGMKIGENGRA